MVPNKSRASLLMFYIIPPPLVHTFLLTFGKFIQRLSHSYVPHNLYIITKSVQKKSETATKMIAKGNKCAKPTSAYAGHFR